MMGGRGGGMIQGMLWRPLWENPKGQRSGEGGGGRRRRGRGGPAPALREGGPAPAPAPGAQGSGRRDEQKVLSVNN